jgi:hypothetical protein
MTTRLLSPGWVSQVAATPNGYADTKRCIDAFFEGFVRMFNSADSIDAWLSRGRKRVKDDGLVVPRILGGKHGTILKRLCATWGVDQVLALIDVYFSTTDPVIRRGDYSVEWFNMHAQRMLTQAGRVDGVTAHNMDAAYQALKEI